MNAVCLSTEASTFPGRYPREVVRALSRINPDLQLRWSSYFEAWEVWHKNSHGRPYCFYRHRSETGGYREADTGLVLAVMSRSNGTSHGQQWLHEHKKLAYNKMPNTKNPELEAWRLMQRN